MSLELALGYSLLAWLVVCGLPVLGWVLLCTLYDSRARRARGYEARSWSAFASESQATGRRRGTSTECATDGPSQGDTVTQETPRAPNRTTARGVYTTGPDVTSAAVPRHGDRMTAASHAQMIAWGDAAPMPAWRFDALQARADLEQRASFTHGDDDAASCDCGAPRCERNGCHDYPTRVA